MVDLGLYYVSIYFLKAEGHLNENVIKRSIHPSVVGLSRRGHIPNKSEHKTIQRSIFLFNGWRS